VPVTLWEVANCVGALGAGDGADKVSMAVGFLLEREVFPL